MAEDKSFKAADRQKFKGWIRKWQMARIPLLSCLFIELLSPAKALSLAFQSESIDTVSSISHVENARKQLDRIQKKDVESLPTVKRFLEKTEKTPDGKFSYQNVVLHSFEEGKECIRSVKNDILKELYRALEARLEVGEMIKMATTMLNTEGWERRNEEGDMDVSFADEYVAELYEHFKEPLSKAGVGTLNDLLQQWHSLVEYTLRYLDPSRTHYLRVWRRIYDSSRRVDWDQILILIELLFSIPISNAKVERLFSLMKRVKTDSRASLGEVTLNSVVRICLEGPSVDDFDATQALKLWSSTANRRPHQQKRKPYRKKSKDAKRAKVLVDMESSSSESNEEMDTLIDELENLD